MTVPRDIADGRGPRLRALAGAVAGVLAAAVAVGAAQFASGLGDTQSSPVLAVGQAAIDLTPPRVKDFAISGLGADDRTVLFGGILVVLALYAAVVGMLAVRRLAFGMWGLAIPASIGLAAALTRPTATAGYVVPTLVGAAAGAVALTVLAREAGRLGAPLNALYPSGPRPEPIDAAQPTDLAPPELPAPPAEAADVARPAVRAGPANSFSYPAQPDDQAPSRWPARRRFLITSGAAAAAAAFGTLAGRNLADEHNVAAAQARSSGAAPRRPGDPVTISVVQTASNYDPPTGTCSFTNPTTAGNCVVVFIFTYALSSQTITTTGVTLGRSARNFQQAVALQTTPVSGDTEYLAAWFDPDCAGGQTTVVASVRNATWQGKYSGTGLILMELSGVASSSALDVTSKSAAGATGTAANSGMTAGTSVAGEMALGAAVPAATFTGYDGSYTNVTMSDSCVAGHMAVADAGTAVSYTATCNEDNVYGAIVFTLKPASATTR
jgi:hypothetical protein